MTKYDYLIIMLATQVSFFGQELSLHNILVWSAVFVAGWDILERIFGKKKKGK